MPTPSTDSPDPLTRKQALRELLLERRRATPPEALAEISHALREALVADELWTRAREIAAFVGVRGEVDTLPLLRRALEQGKRVWLPRLTGPGQMRFWPLDELGDLDRLEPRRRMGLREPPIIGEGVVAPGPEQGVDLVLVPGLGFGRDGARLGFGAGHYDRAFGERHGDPALRMPVLCGVCPAGFVDPEGGSIPMLRHDLRMDYLATELGVELTQLSTTRCTRRRRR